jgi:hypothetical protein
MNKEQLKNDLIELEKTLSNGSVLVEMGLV